MNKHQLSIFNYTANKSNDDTHLNVFIDGVIVDAETKEIYEKWWGDETSVSFKSLRNQVLQSGAKSITFWVNSYGGHVGDAMAIHDWIKELENTGYTIQTKGIGMVCSAATYIVSAAKNSSITKNSWYMIHNVSGGAYGDVRAIENYARTLRKFNDAIADFYQSLTKQPLETINEWMNEEKWFTGTEARDFGFVKETIGEQKFTNSIDPALFPYQNKNALSLYNACVSKQVDIEKNNTDEDKININNLDMKKLQEAIVNAFKSLNLVVSPKKEGAEIQDNEEQQPIAALTEESLTNALITAFKGFDVSEMVNNHLDETFKDGLPENVQQAINIAILDSVREAMKEYPTSKEVQNIIKEFEEVKKDVINSFGGAKPTKYKEEVITDEYDHPDIQWGKK